MTTTAPPRAGPHPPTAQTTYATVLGTVTFDPAPGRWTRTLHRPSTGQQFEVPLSHEHLPAELHQFASNGAWNTIEASADGRTITLTRADTADTPMTLTFSRH
ncbi:hypothetical protein [Streptomyces rubiginosohelvolus]|uniref:hypothetical protein n=1 Tax=Streptomyces rubiginosohelvolus TaxID=67362 RepID=UPI00382576B4